MWLTRYSHLMAKKNSFCKQLSLPNTRMFVSQIALYWLIKTTFSVDSLSQINSDMSHSDSWPDNGGVDGFFVDFWIPKPLGFGSGKWRWSQQVHQNRKRKSLFFLLHFWSACTNVWSVQFTGTVNECHSSLDAYKSQVILVFGGTKCDNSTYLRQSSLSLFGRISPYQNETVWLRSGLPLATVFSFDLKSFLTFFLNDYCGFNGNSFFGCTFGGISFRIFPALLLQSDW